VRSFRFLAPGGQLHSLGELIRTLPPRQLRFLWAAVFSTFSVIGFVLDILTHGRQPPVLLALNVIASGVFAIGYAVASAQRRATNYAVIITAHLGYTLIVPQAFELYAQAPPNRLTLDAIGMLIAMTLGYSMFLRFINVTATRYLRAKAEIDVARDIHRVLTPPIARTIGCYELFGWSVASGDVGGDLVDVIDGDDGWLGYVADVSGHGVGPGVVMGMFKSALRMRARTGGPIADVLTDIHAVMMPIKQPATFVTVACIRAMPDDAIECAVAGHLPILRIRDRVVAEVTDPQLAVGMFEDTQFASIRIGCLSGDLFALLTDGLVEVFDGDNRELGLDWAKRVLVESSSEPLDAIAGRLLAGARAHGPQLDDQTLLLIRRR
jgi:serine phosphatase RsbU (regulator of sigma subunit)